MKKRILSLVLLCFVAQVQCMSRKKRGFSECSRPRRSQTITPKRVKIPALWNGSNEQIFHLALNELAYFSQNIYKALPEEAKNNQGFIEKTNQYAQIGTRLASQETPYETKRQLKKVFVEYWDQTYCTIIMINARIKKLQLSNDQ